MLTDKEKSVFGNWSEDVVKASEEAYNARYNNNASINDKQRDIIAADNKLKSAILADERNHGSIGNLYFHNVLLVDSFVFNAGLCL